MASDENTSQDGSEGSAEAEEADTNSVTPGDANSTAEGSGYGAVRPGGRPNADGQFDFERVLQDFVLLTFLVSS